MMEMLSPGLQRQLQPYCSRPIRHIDHRQSKPFESRVLQALAASPPPQQQQKQQQRGLRLRPGSSRLVAAAAAAAAAASAAGQAGDDGSQQQQQAFLRVVLPTALALMLCNMDRICLSVAMVPIAAELGWGTGVQGLVQSAFLYGYLATQLLGGTLADKYGGAVRGPGRRWRRPGVIAWLVINIYAQASVATFTATAKLTPWRVVGGAGKVVMGVGIAWFSLASLLLPLAAITPATAALGLTLPAVLAARFMVGFGEGVALPAMNNLVARNVPAARRATALGTVFTGFHSGAGGAGLRVVDLFFGSSWLWANSERFLPASSPPPAAAVHRQPGGAAAVAAHPAGLGLARPLLHLWHPRPAAAHPLDPGGAQHNNSSSSSSSSTRRRRSRRSSGGGGGCSERAHQPGAAALQAGDLGDCGGQLCQPLGLLHLPQLDAHLLLQSAR